MSGYVCTACQKAEINPRWGEYWETCLGCKARMLADSPLARDAIDRKAGAARAFQIQAANICPHDPDGFKAKVRYWYDKLNPAPVDTEGQGL